MAVRTLKIRGNLDAAYADVARTFVEQALAEYEAIPVEPDPDSLGYSYKTLIARLFARQEACARIPSGMLSGPMTSIFGLMTRLIRTLGDTRSEPLNTATKT